MSSDFLNDTVISKYAVYHKSCYDDYNDTMLTRTKASQHITPQSIASSRTERKHNAEECICECVFRGKKDRLSGKKRNSVLHTAGKLHTLNNHDAKHVHDLTKECQHMASVLVIYYQKFETMLELMNFSATAIACHLLNGDRKIIMENRVTIQRWLIQWLLY